MPWYEHGTKNACANCGEYYIQDCPQEDLDDITTERHPDARVLCPKCRLYFSAFDSLKDPKTYNEMLLAMYIDQINQELKELRIDLYMSSLFTTKDDKNDS